MLRLGGGPGLDPPRRAQHEREEEVGTLSEPEDDRGLGLGGSGRSHGLHVPGDKELRDGEKPHGHGDGGVAGPRPGRLGGEAAVHPGGGGAERHSGGPSASDRCVSLLASVATSYLWGVCVLS